MRKFKQLVNDFTKQQYAEWHRWFEGQLKEEVAGYIREDIENNLKMNPIERMFVERYATIVFERHLDHIRVRYWLQNDELWQRLKIIILRDWKDFISE